MNEEKQKQYIDLSTNTFWKQIDGVWIGKPAVKDLDYKGHRYGWAEDFENYREIE